MIGEDKLNLTPVSIIGDGLEVDEVRSDDVGVHRVVVPQLQLDALAQWREHLREHDLLVPHRGVRVLAHACIALEFIIIIRIWDGHLPDGPTTSS